MKRTFVGVLLISAAAGTSAQGVVLPDFLAAPDVYKVRAESNRYRLVEGVGKPGQRDAFHSHPAFLYYWVTPCSLRFYMPDGTVDARAAALQ